MATTLNVISSSYGNDSIALIQWAREHSLLDVTVVFVDTGWSAPGLMYRITKAENWARSHGFATENIRPKVQFEELMRLKQGLACS